jgi:predicted unusual protein kinase regulating ubiquinone biosynthesis (AarF/ABC1/UbiB family)
VKRGTLVALTAATAAAIVTGVLWRRRSASGGAAPLVVRGTSRAARSLDLARVGAKSSGSYVVHRARRAVAPAHEREHLDEAFQLKTAEAVAEALGNMKGALMKLGQMASYLDQGLPEHVRGALADLRQDAPPMSAELAAGVIERELGKAPEQLFASWDPRPVASASIGQVHHAVTHDGREVAVKVQYPGVDDAIRADLANVDLLFSATGMLFPGLDPKALVAELKERLVEELDYRLEAENQRLFADYYAGHPFITVPGVVDELSTTRVLTTDWSDGARFDEVASSWSPDERNLAAEAIYRFVFGSLYRLKAFNGDPHPGNYLFEPGGRVTFLDFGRVKRFTPDEVKVFHDMIDTMVLDHDPGAFRRVIERVGLLRAGELFTDDEVEHYFGHFYEFVLIDEVTTIDQEYASETVRQMFDLTGPHGEIMKAANVPPSFVIIQRINLGLYAVLGELNATANWRRIAEEIWPFVDGAPSTPLGVEEGVWRRRTGH